MAGTTVPATRTGMSGSDVEALLLEHNKLVDDVATLAAAVIVLVAKLNADAGVTDTNYAATAQAALLAAKVSDNNGNTTF